MREPNMVCSECGASFWRKASHAAKPTKWGVFCSVQCTHKRRGLAWSQDGNPKWKGKNVDSDGYRIYVPQASRGLGLGAMKEHQAIVCLELGIDRPPSGLHIHHRDCNILNNEPWNLALMGVSDHKWLHKQFGNATLWAVTHGRVDVDELVSWSDEPDRAWRLLLQGIQEQALWMRLHGINTDAGIVRYIERPVRLERPEIVEVDELSSTARGAGGFGSTGA